MHICPCTHLSLFFFFNDTATTEIYTLSLHDALPILASWLEAAPDGSQTAPTEQVAETWPQRVPPCADRKSTRLNSSHQIISYAVFCLKKKKHTTSSNDLAASTHVRHTIHKKSM